VECLFQKATGNIKSNNRSVKKGQKIKYISTKAD